MMVTIQGTALAAALSIDLNAAGATAAGLYLVLWWVAPSTTEAGSGYSMDCTGTDPLGYPVVFTGGTGDGNASEGKAGQFFLYYNGTGTFTFDIGYSAPFSALRLNYKVTFWQFQ